MATATSFCGCSGMAKSTRGWVAGGSTTRLRSPPDMPTPRSQIWGRSCNGCSPRGRTGATSLIARFAAYETAFRVLYMLDDPGVDGPDSTMLFESLLSADPSGKEGRPGSAP